MVKRNPHMAKLNAGYLFPEVNKRKKAFLARYPTADLIHLGIGDTTEPLPPCIAEGLMCEAAALGTPHGYTGYGPEQGYQPLRQQLAVQIYQNNIDAEDIFISDGSKCDIGRLQVLFGSQATTAVQDPSYPVYVDSSVILGQTEAYDASQNNYHGIVYMPCSPANGFFPDLSRTPRTDLIYFCSPNNPTGAVASRDQLTALVAFAKRNRSILIYDAAYAAYIHDPALPRSIYEIEGAEKVAIELGSFSKMAGFTGVRLGWSVVPPTLCFDDGCPVQSDWRRIHSTLFNGASNIAQAGGLAALTPQGLTAMQALVDLYMQNVALLRDTFEELGYKCYGGRHAPYLWVAFPGRSSWLAFEELLEKVHLVATPGSGFGPSGEGFLRFSAFGKRSRLIEATERLNKSLAFCSNGP